MADNTFATPLNQRPAELRHRPGLAQRDQVPQRPLRRVRRGAGRAGGDPGPDLGRRRCSPAPCSARSTRGCCCAGCAPCRCGCRGTTPTAWRSRRRWKSTLPWRGCTTRASPSHPQHELAGEPDERLRRGARRSSSPAASRRPTPSSAGCATPAGRPASAAWSRWPCIRRPCGAGCSARTRSPRRVSRSGLVRLAAGTEDTADLVADALAAADVRSAKRTAVDR